MHLLLKIHRVKDCEPRKNHVYTHTYTHTHTIGNETKLWRWLKSQLGFSSFRPALAVFICFLFSTLRLEDREQHTVHIWCFLSVAGVMRAPSLSLPPSFNAPLVLCASPRRARWVGEISRPGISSWFNAAPPGGSECVTWPYQVLFMSSQWAHTQQPQRS